MDAISAAKAWDLTFRSIREQSWADWRVTVLVPGAREAETARSAIGHGPAEDAGRFAVIEPSDTAAWGAAIASHSDTDMPAASLIAFLAAGDELGRDALGAFAVASGIHPRADCFYADEFRLTPECAQPEAFFKPDFSPSLLLATNYIGRPIVVRPSLLAAIGVTAAALMRDGLHDLALRCTEAAAETHHVAELLSRTDGGVAANLDDDVGRGGARDGAARRRRRGTAGANTSWLAGAGAPRRSPERSPSSYRPARRRATSRPA